MVLIEISFIDFETGSMERINVNQKKKENIYIYKRRAESMLLFAYFRFATLQTLFSHP